MHVARRLEEVTRNENSVVTIGTFDGVHLGHRAILEEVVRKARVFGGRAVLVTFHPHPRVVTRGEQVPLLTSMEERIALFRETGIDVTLVIDFTKAFSELSAGEFYNGYIVGGIGVREVIVGHDHMFGRDRLAGPVMLRSLGERVGFKTTIIGPVHMMGGKVSSSRIRKLLGEGLVDDAGAFLGRPYRLAGTVVRGDGRGAGIGFPTANLAPVDTEKVVPARGVYFVRADWGSTSRYGMLNIGSRPTFVEDGRVVVEAHLFDWEDEIYGETVDVQFLRKIRDEKKFSNVQEFISQLERDRNACMAYVPVAQEH